MILCDWLILYKKEFKKSSLINPILEDFLLVKKISDLSISETWQAILLNCCPENLIIYYDSEGMIYFDCYCPHSNQKINIDLQSNFSLALDLIDDLIELEIKKIKYEHIACLDKIKVKGRTFIEAGLKMWLLVNLGKSVYLPTHLSTENLKKYASYQIYPEFKIKE